LVHLTSCTSILSGVEIIEEIKIRWPATFELSVAAMLISIIIPAGVLAAVRKNSVVDNLTMSALIGVSMPVYWFSYFDLPFAVNLNGCRLAGESVLRV